MNLFYKFCCLALGTCDLGIYLVRISPIISPLFSGLDGNYNIHHFTFWQLT